MMRAATVASPPSPPRRFDRFELQPGERLFLGDGVPIALGTRAFDLLVALSDRPGALITKDELLAAVWPGLVVEENNLQVQVSTLRKILGPGALATIPGRGYRFNLPVASADAFVPARPAASSGASAGDASEHGIASFSNLPLRSPRLYGRDADLTTIVALLREHAVITITGSGGIGKTRLAQAIAMHVAAERPTAYPDGVWWIELASLTDGALVPSTIAEAMGARVEGERPTALALQAQLATKRALLVLDNCEHLADAVATLIDMITAGAPRVGLLVTSQETLRATDEHVYRLGGLAVPDVAGLSADVNSGAVELFDARAKAADPRFAITAANRPAVIEICRRLDGIPLAIELAAARVSLLGVEGLRGRLHERFNLLTGGARMVLRRHQTLRATLEWSHALLTADEQTVFRRLSVFAGGFTLEAAQHVASDDRIDPWTTLDHLGALVDKSLVLAEGDSIPRYRMLETARAYALERLTDAGENQATLRRHAQAILAVLQPFEQHEWGSRSTGSIEPAAKLELDNLRAALEWADANADGPLAIDLAGASYSVWWSSFHLAEGLSRCLALRPHINPRVPSSAAARFWLTIAQLGVYSTRRESYDAAVRAANLYLELDDEQRAFQALTFAAVQGTRFATIAEMGAQIEQAARLERAEWPARQRAKLQFARCFWYARQSRFEAALACAQRQVQICRDGGVEVGALYAMSNVTLMLVQLGRAQEALEDANTAIARLHVLGADAGAGHLYFSAITALLWLDRIDDAMTAARNAYPRLMHEGDQHRLLLPLALLNALSGRGAVAVRIDAFDRAVQARSGENTSVISPRLRERLDPLLGSGISVDERARLEAQGSAMTDEDAFTLAFGNEAWAPSS